MRMSIIIMLS